MSSALVCTSSGAYRVTLGERCSVHASAVIEARKGPIEIEDDNCIDERVVICNESSETMRIGVGNWFQVGSVVRAKRVGDYNVFKPRCVVEANAAVGDGCSVGAAVRVVHGTLVDNTSTFRCFFRSAASCNSARCA